MSARFSPSALKSLESTAMTAAAYLDACDAGAHHVRLDADYYRQCAILLTRIFGLMDPRTAFPELLAHSAAARNAAEGLELARRIGLSRLGFYPELSSVLQRAAA